MAPNSNVGIRTEMVSGETITCQLDAPNRLISVVLPETGRRGFTYGGFGNLWQFVAASRLPE